MFYILVLFFVSIFSIFGFVFALNKKSSEKSLVENFKSSPSVTFNHSKSIKPKWWSVFAWFVSFVTTTLTGAYLVKKTHQKPVSVSKLNRLNILRQKIQAKQQSWLSKPKPSRTSDWKQRLRVLLRQTKNK